MTDAELIQRYRMGDETAFTTLYNTYRKPLYAYLNGLAGGRMAVADDLFQQTWIRIIEHLPRYRDRDRFLAWALRIARNLAIDHFRRQRWLRNEDCEPDRAPAAVPNPLNDIEQREFDDCLEKAICNLPAEQRDVVLLRRQGLAFKEIAAIQRTGVNTVLGRMHYALKKLRQELNAWIG